MTWIRLKKGFVNKKGKKIPLGTKWNMISTQAAEWVQSGRAEYCNKNDDKMDTQIFKPK